MKLYEQPMRSEDPEVAKAKKREDEMKVMAFMNGMNPKEVLGEEKKNEEQKRPVMKLSTVGRPSPDKLN